MSTLTLPAGRLDTAAFDTAAFDEPLPRGVGVVWVLVWFNVLTYSPEVSTLVHIPSVVGKVLTQGCLVAAAVLALGLNGRGVIRRNTMLLLWSVLAATSLMMSLRLVGVGTTYRGFRLVAFVAVLWLLTRWFGEDEMVFVRLQRRVLLGIVASAALGFAISPSKAFGIHHRLNAVIWGILPTQLAHYSAELAGLTLILWACGLLRRRAALPVVLVGVTFAVLTHTRTALAALVVGLAVALLSLLTARRGLRRAVAAGIVAAAVIAPVASPVVLTWLERGQTTQQINNLTGRTKVWEGVVTGARPLPNVVLGSGMSNDAFNGLPIDDSWLAIYQDQGLFGDAVMAAMLLALLLVAATRPRGPARAVALFLIVYCIPASITETGLGQANPYMLDLFVAASLLVSSPRHRQLRLAA